MGLYYYTGGLYLLASALIHPVICIFAWMLLGRIRSNRLQPYARWFTPGVVATTISTSAVLLLAFVTYFDRQNYYVLASVCYFLYLIAFVFDVIAFVRLWKVVAALPPSLSEPWQKADDGLPQEGVWPPPPKF